MRTNVPKNPVKSLWPLMPYISRMVSMRTAFAITRNNVRKSAESLPIIIFIFLIFHEYNEAVEKVQFLNFSKNKGSKSFQAVKI